MSKVKGAKPNQSFFSPKLTGKRFDNHTVPVEILDDFRALQELFTEIAKDLYFKDHPTRKRVPNGFTEGVTLSLSNISEGSTILDFLLVTTLTAHTVLGPSSNDYTYYERAKEKVEEIVKTAVLDNSNNSVKTLGNADYLKYFNRIGRNLKDDETLFFNSQNPQNGAYITRDVRQKIVKQLSEGNTYNDKFDIKALVNSIDKSNNSFTVEVGSNKLTSELGPKLFKTIITPFSNYSTKTYVRITGDGEYNNADKLIAITKISDLDVLDPLDMSIRLAELSKLKDGWYDSLGKSLSKKGLSLFEELFLEHYNNELPLPATFPTIEGNLHLEWTINGKEMSLEVHLPSINAEFQSVEIKNLDVIEQQLDLREKKGWEKLTKLLS